MYEYYGNFLPKTFTSVKWNGTVSQSKLLFSGVRQGGILFSALFSVYSNDLLLKLKSCNFGGFIQFINFNVFIYAYMFLVTIFIYDMQAMIDTCEHDF